MLGTTPDHQQDTEQRTPLLDRTSSTSLNAPEDKYHVAYWLTFFLGMAMLFPWNTFITASDYWESRFKGSPYESNYNNYITLTTQVSNIVFLALLLRYSYLMSLRMRILIPIFLQLIVFSIQAVLVKQETVEPDVFMGFLVICCVICGATTSALQGGLFGLAGILPEVYTQALMLGMALAGLIVASLNVINIKEGSNLGYNPSFVYFVTTCIVLFFSLFSFWVLSNLPIVRHYQGKTSGSNDKMVHDKYNFSRTFMAIYDQLFNVGYNFFITLAIFPSLTSRIIDHSHWLVTEDGSNLFVPVFCFVIFNAGDVCGRALSAYSHIFTPKTLRYAVLARTLFIPLFLLCDIKYGLLSAVLFHSDVWYILFIVLFSVSNGYLGSLCMMYAPQQVIPEDGECAGTMMVFSLTTGLLIGSWFSFVFVSVV
eukprot:CFRG5372T1